MRSDARKRLEEPENECDDLSRSEGKSSDLTVSEAETVTPCEDCGKPEGSFACRIRHIHMDTSWAKGDH